MPHLRQPEGNNIGDPDPLSAGTMGDAALWGGSSMAMGMAANLLKPIKVGIHKPAENLPERYAAPCSAPAITAEYEAA